MGRDQPLTVKDVERLLFQGKHIVIMDKNVLQLDGWLTEHPGGRLVILHMVGRDATNEINIYHTASTLQRMHKYRVGVLTEPWTNKTPPIRGGIFENPDSAPGSACDSDSDWSDATTICSNTSSYEIKSADQVQRIRVAVTKLEDEPVELKQIRPNHANVVLQKRDAATTAYIEKAIQAEIGDNLRDYPSLDRKTQDDIEVKYKALHDRVKADGFYECHYGEYAKELSRYLSIFALFLTALCYGWYLTSGALLGLFWHQIMFTAHDAGHRGITQNFVYDTLIGIFIADFCCGLSIGWWKSSHNVHHLLTNHTEHDPDIQNVPLFATCPSFFKSIHSSYYDFTFIWDKAADYAVRYQKYTYYPVMGIARFNLYILSLHHLILGPRPSRSTRWIRKTEITGIACYWFLFGYCLVWRTLPDWPTRIGFVLISHIITMPLHVQITLSHWGMATADLGEGESFPQRQLRTTMDVDCPAWLDFIHGGLQFQAVHHLFPRVPRHNLRRLQVLVREFCEDCGIKYTILNFVNGNKKVLSRLDEVTAQMELMLKCQKYMAETGESGLH